jgi:hypothetical protein
MLETYYIPRGVISAETLSVTAWTADYDVVATGGAAGTAIGGSGRDGYGGSNCGGGYGSGDCGGGWGDSSAGTGGGVAGRAAAGASIGGDRGGDYGYGTGSD